MNGIEWDAALSAMRTGIGGHPDTRINSRIRVSVDPSDRQMPVGAAVVNNLILCILHFVANLALLCVPSGDDAIGKKPELKILSNLQFP